MGGLTKVALLVVGLTLAGEARAADDCRARIDPRTGTVEVSASAVSGALRWGDREGAENNDFDNASRCLAGGHARACRLGPPGTEEGMTPPDLCRIFLRDAQGPCAAYVRGCTPGLRAFGDAARALVAALTLEDDGAALRLSGVNLQIVSGSGRTDGPVNGRGNLIVGYNGAVPEIPSPARTGSHNVVIGDGHVYTSFGGLVAGRGNEVSAPAATVSGGELNAAREAGASVSGGTQNIADGLDASVTGGQLGQASGTEASVTGGGGNLASGPLAVVTGGLGNSATGANAAVSGGASNRASDPNSSVSGGSQNAAIGTSASISGGTHHAAFSTNGWGAGSLFQDQ